MHREDLELVRDAVKEANSFAYDYELTVEIFEERDDAVRVRSYPGAEDEEIQETQSIIADVKFLGDFHGRPMLSVHLDGDQEPIIIEALGWVLNAVLYAVP